MQSSFSKWRNKDIYMEEAKTYHLKVGADPGFSLEGGEISKEWHN